MDRDDAEFLNVNVSEPGEPGVGDDGVSMLSLHDAQPSMTHRVAIDMNIYFDICFYRYRGF